MGSHNFNRKPLIFWQKNFRHLPRLACAWQASSVTENKHSRRKKKRKRKRKRNQTNVPQAHPRPACSLPMHSIRHEYNPEPRKPSTLGQRHSIELFYYIYNAGRSHRRMISRNHIVFKREITRIVSSPLWLTQHA